MTTQRQLQTLHEMGWSDADVASWIHKEIEKVLVDDLDGRAVSRPSSQTLYRWRNGQSMPNSIMAAALITRLHRKEKPR